MLFSGSRFSVLYDEKVLEIGGITMWIHLTLLDCTPKNSEDDKFYVMCTLPLIQTKKYFENILSKLFSEIIKYFELLILPVKAILLKKLTLFFGLCHVVTF